MNVKDTTPVGQYPAGASPYGLLDMAGNVWEWTQTKWRDDYTTPADDNPEGNVVRVVRGGSWLYNRWNLRAASRLGYVPGYFRYDVGLRVVVSL